MNLSLRKLRIMIASEEAKRAAQQARHAADVSAGRCCMAHHYGCTEARRHSHTLEGDVVLTLPADGKEAER